MLGTGIASADEDVNPDKPASPLDGSVTVPVHIDNNVLGTPLGQKALPAVRRDVTVGTARITRALPTPKTAPVTEPVTKVTGTTAPVVRKAQSAVAPLEQEGRDFAAPLAEKAKPVTEEIKKLPGGDKLPPVPSLDRVHVPAVDKMGGTPAQDNQLNADLVVPVDVSGNAVAALGKAGTVNGSEQSYGTDRDVHTDGSHGSLGGNVVDLDWALPVQVTNNAAAVLGKAYAEGCGSQEAWATGDIVTDGRHSVLGGNVVAPQLATPVQVDGNAVAGGGWATAISYTDTTAESGGSVLTNGMDGAGSGNAVPVPVAVPARVNGNALMGLGEAQAWTESTADATAGATRTGMYGVPTYVETNGDPALAAGNIVHPAVSGPAMLCGNAGGVAGEADAVCDTATTAAAGGTNRTTGAGSTVSGAIADAPVVLPVQGFGNAVAGLGEATAVSDNAVDSTAGGDSYTRGHDSIVSGTVAKAPVTGTGDVFANSLAVAGQAGSAAQNDVVVHSGGNAGTTGDDSLVGGNMVATPLVAPAEVYGNAAAGGGTAEAAAEETKTTESGSGRNTDDDFGVLASNLVTVPVATAAQVFGNGAGALAITDARASAIEEFSAGGDNRATGITGLGSGNIGQVPVAVPFQVFGSGVSGLGKGTQAAVNDTEMEAGGDSVSDGTRGTLAGNVVTAPIAGAGQVFGESVAVLGRNYSLAGSETETEAGGDTATSGQNGLVSGNVAAPQALPIAQTFAVVASGAGGVNAAAATNETEAESGGDIDTTGEEGYLSGNLVDVPAAAVVQPFGDAVAAIASRSYAQGLSETKGEVGGTSTTSGRFGSLSGIDGTLPIGADVPVYDVPVEVLAQAMTESANNSDLQAGEGEAQMLRLPAEGAMGATELPSFSTQRAMPTDGFRGAFTGVLTGLPDDMTGLPGRGQVADVADLAANGGLPEVPQILPAPARADTGLVPGLPVALPGLPTGLPAVVPGLPTDGLTAVPGLPTGGPGGGAVPGLPIDSLNTGLPTNVPGLPTNVLNGTSLPGLPAGGLPTDAVKGGLPTGVPGLPTGVVPGGVVNQNLPSYRLSIDLPTDGITGDLPTSDLPIGLPAQQRDLPVDGVTGALSTNLPVRLDDLPTETIIGGLPTGDLPVDVPVRRDLPTDGITGGLPLNGLPLGGLPVDVPVQRDLPTDSLTGGLPVGDLPAGDLSLNGLSVGALPLNGLPVGTLPLNGLPIGVPVQRDLPQIPALPVTGGLPAPLSAVSLDRFGGFGSRTDVPEHLTEVTTLIPAIPATDDLTDITTVLPVIPAAPIGQAPAVGTLPVPAVDGVAAPELDGSSLDSTRAALANLFTTRPIA